MIYKLFGSILVCTTAVTSYAASTIDFILKQPGQTPDVAQTAYVDNGKILIKAAGGDPSTDLLFEKSTETMTIISHVDKTTLDIDAQKIGVLASQAQGMMSMVQQQLAKQMENMSEAEKEKFQKMIESMGGGQLVQPVSAPPEQTYRDAGPRTINGYDCQVTEILEDGVKVAETCTAEPETLALPTTDYEVIQAMQAMSHKLRQQTAKLSQQMGQNVPQFGNADIPGIPVLMQDKAGNSMTITQVQSGISNVVLSKPQGYQAKQLPSMPQLTQ